MQVCPMSTLRWYIDVWRKQWHSERRRGMAFRVLPTLFCHEELAAACLKIFNHSRSVSYSTSLSCLLPLMKEYWSRKHNGSHIMICVLGSTTQAYPAVETHPKM